MNPPEPSEPSKFLQPATGPSPDDVSELSQEAYSDALRHIDEYSTSSRGPSNEFDYSAREATTDAYNTDQQSSLEQHAELLKSEAPSRDAESKDHQIPSYYSSREVEASKEFPFAYKSDGSPLSTNQVAPATWLPTTLRLPFITSLTCSAALLGVATLFITIYSQTHNGLGRDDGSSGVLFAWRFTPTLVAVLYTLCTTALLLDVRRTEIFARLSRPGGASASATLCFPSRQWWNDPQDALKKRRNGGLRSWALLWGSVVNTLAFLIISPLSAGLLAPVNVQVSQRRPARWLDMPETVDYTTGSNDTMMFKTIAGGVLNKSTSAWIRDDYYVTPFWPTTSPKSLGASFSAAGVQRWTARREAYRAELDCAPVYLRDTQYVTGPRLFEQGICDVWGCDNSSMRYANFTRTEVSTDDADGCSITIFQGGFAYADVGSTRETYVSSGGGWWTNSFSNLTWQPDLQWPSGSNASSSCAGRSYLSFHDTWPVGGEPEMQGYMCSTRYLKGDVLATVTVSEGSTQVSFNHDDFLGTKAELDTSKFNIQINIQKLEDMFFDANWLAHFPDDWKMFRGPSLALAAMYNNDTQSLVDSKSIIEDSRRLLQQWLGQMLLAAQVSAQGEDGSISGSTDVVTTERRIVVVEWVGLVIGVFLLVSAVLLAALMFLSRLRRRPLGLHNDPASIAVATSLITSDLSTRDGFQGLAHRSDSTIKKQLKNTRYSLSDGSLRATQLDPLLEGSSTDSDSTKARSLDQSTRNPTPVVLRLWMGPLLLAALFILIGAIAALYQVSRTIGLHQRALVYEYDFDVASLTTMLAPCSIVPTLFAIGIKLWYGAIEQTLRRAQPFLAMAKHPRDVAHSVLIEYANSPLILGSIKAMRHSDWVLALVCLGAIGTEIFTISISALWDREVQIAIQNVKLNRQLELRQVPRILETYTAGSGSHTYNDPTLPTLLKDVYGNYLTSWLYGGLLETMEATSTPPWSKDEWSFALIDFSLSSSEILKLSKNSTDFNTLSYNVTVETPALRARLDCTPFKSILNTSNWVTTWDFNDERSWNASNRPKDLDVGYEIKAYVYDQYSAPGSSGSSPSILPGRSVVKCCANETDGVAGEAAIGFATTTGYIDASALDKLFVKWIVGTPLNGFYHDSNRSTQTHWIWREEPQGQAVTCSPIIEQANASVTVDLATGTVNNYTITDTPQNATGAWLDNGVARDPYYPVPDKQRINGWRYNITYGYGWQFWNGLVYSSNLKSASALLTASPPQQDNDRVFNMREHGVNLDFISSSALRLAGDDRRVLLDADVLADRVSRAFGVYFKHFASEQVDPVEGGRAFQRIGARLPADLPGLSSTFAASGGWFNDSVAAVDIATTTEARVHYPIDVLVMSPVAVFLCLGVLAFLCLVTVAIHGFYRNRFRELPRDVDTLASVLAFVYRSPRLLEWVRERGETGNWKDNGIGGVLAARLGPFDVGDGTVGWGVELVDQNSH